MAEVVVRENVQHRAIPMGAREFPLGGGMDLHTLSTDDPDYLEVQLIDRGLTPISVSWGEENLEFKIADLERGPVHPQFISRVGLDPLKWFGGVFCAGPDNVGPPCSIPGTDIPMCSLHGDMPFAMPSKPLEATKQMIQLAGWDSPQRQLVLSADFNFSSLMVNTRNCVDITANYLLGLLSKDELGWFGRITLSAISPSYSMFLVHPIFKVPPGSEIYVTAEIIKARDKTATDNLANWQKWYKIGKPEMRDESCFFGLNLVSNDNFYRMLIVNKEHTAGVLVRYSRNIPDELARMAIWANYTKNIYGLEFGSLPLGRADALDCLRAFEQGTGGDAWQNMRVPHLLLPEKDVEIEYHVVFLNTPEKVSRELDIVKSVCPTGPRLYDHNTWANY